MAVAWAAEVDKTMNDDIGEGAYDGATVALLVNAAGHSFSDTFLVFVREPYSCYAPLAQLSEIQGHHALEH